MCPLLRTIWSQRRFPKDYPCDLARLFLKLMYGRCSVLESVESPRQSKAVLQELDKDSGLAQRAVPTFFHLTQYRRGPFALSMIPFPRLFGISLLVSPHHYRSRAHPYYLETLRSLRFQRSTLLPTHRRLWDELQRCFPSDMTSQRLQQKPKHILFFCLCRQTSIWPT